MVVSHDRHLLRNTVEEFYLVHDKKVEEFKGDLEDYQKWLNEQNSAPENKSSEKNDDNENSMQNRKEQKRREAELRQQTAPLRKQISQLEEKMNKHASKLAEIENQLADSELYSAENKEKLTALLAQQVEVKKALEESRNGLVGGPGRIGSNATSIGTAYESKSFPTHKTRRILPTMWRASANETG